MYEKMYLVGVAGASPDVEDGANSYNDAFRKAEAWAKETPGARFVIYEAVSAVEGGVRVAVTNLRNRSEK